MTRTSSGMESRRRENAAGRCPIGYHVAMAIILILLQSVPVTPITPTGPNHIGREFIFAIPPNYIQDGNQPHIGIIIESASQNITVVNVSVPLRNLRFNLTLDPQSPPRDLPLPSDLVGAMISGLTVSTVVVRSDGDIAVVAYNYKTYTMDMFTVLPTAQAGNEYFVATFTQPSGGVISISAFAEPVTVSVQLTESVEFLNVMYKRGNSINHVLHPYHTMQLEPMLPDIVGTRIIANSSITVTVGSLCAYVPVGMDRCDHLSEQLIPFDRWGRSFLLNPFINRLSGYQYHVVAGRNDTRIMIGTQEIHLNTGQYFLGDITDQRIISIKADKPVMIMQYSKGTNSDNRHGDPAMLLVPPMEQYVTRMEFPVYPLRNAGINTVYLAVTVECNSSYAIHLDNLKPDQIPWSIEYDVTTQDGRFFCTRWMTIEGGRHVLHSESSAEIERGQQTVFSAVVYGVGERIAYLYNPGMNLKKLTCTVPSSTSPDQKTEGPCRSPVKQTCEEETTWTAYGNITWKKTTKSCVVVADVLCPTNTLKAFQPVATRECVVDNTTGARWRDPVQNNCGLRSSPLLTSDLAKVVVDASNVAAVSGVLEDLTGSLNKVNDEMVGDISQTLENIVGVATPSPEVTTSVVKTVGNLMGSLGSTQSTSDELAASSSSIVNSVENQVSLTLRDRGEFTLAEKNMVVRATTVEAFALEDGVHFTGSGDSGSSIKLPSSVFTQKKEKRADIQSTGAKVRFITFNDDSLFRSGNYTQTSGSVISAAIDGAIVEELDEPVLITFDISENSADMDVNNSQCVYWDFELRDGVGDWSTYGCMMYDVSENEITCACNHLTNFAVLMDISGQHDGNKTKFHFALDILSKIGCAISIIALVITIGVFVVFKRLRNSRPRRILLHFCVSLLCLYLVFLLGIDNSAHIDIACVTVGALVHYFILTTMLWMGVEALNMYLLIVRVFDEEGPRFLMKSCVVAWGAPIIVVGVTVGVRMDDYLHKSYCFLTPGLSFFIAVLLPIGLILAFNFIMFIVVVRRLWTANLYGNTPMDKEDKAIRYRQLRTRVLNAFSISVLLGLTWVFGFLAIEGATFAFQLVFCLANSLQGLVVFILFCARQEDVRKSIKPHYSRLTSMLPQPHGTGGGRPSTVTAYSLTSRSMSKPDSDDPARNPLRTAPVKSSKHSRKVSSSELDVKNSNTTSTTDGSYISQA